LDLLLRPGQIKLGGILDEQNKIDLSDSLVRALDVRLQDLPGSDFLVVAETVTGLNVSLGLQGGRDTDVGSLAEYIGELPCSFRQSEISKLAIGELVG
jgi:hypothetical protein